ncbi:MAG: gliding motility-associated C-terminal domain-containing protein [Bacteroidia bacterium]|nr:gliding motility-associated C-terminal domain-containing protein [Bacteroidia bacterium]
MTRFLLVLSIAVLPFRLFSQFALNGSATANGPICYTLTPNLGSQAGSVWYTSQIDLSQNFEFYAQITLGCSDNGADGVVFAFQSVSTSVGSLGGGMGYAGISPSIGVEFDTYQNSNWGDPVTDHMAIISNGDVSHLSPTNLAGPVSMLPTNANVEDCLYHDLRVSWNPFTDSLNIYFDCNLRLTYAGNIINTIFGGNPNVFWGFTGGTGALSNLQGFCVDYLSFGLDTLICQGDTLQLGVGSGVSYSWSPAAGLSNPNIATPLAFPDTSTTYIASITDNCGFVRTESFTINLEHDSSLNIDLGSDTILCPGQNILLDAFRPGPSYLWQNGSTASSFTVTTPGLYWVELENICGTRRDSIVVTSQVAPVINLGNDTTLCAGTTLQLDVSTPNATYEWQNGSSAAQQTISTPGIYWVVVSNHCGFDRDSIVVLYESPPLPVNLGNDTILCNNNALTLDVTQPASTYLWQNNSTANSFTIVAPGLYWAQVTNLCGSDRDSITIAYDQTPIVNLGNDTALCQGDILILNAAWTATSVYQWNTGSTSAGVVVSGPGVYSVTVTNTCGSDQDAKQIDYLSPPPRVNLGRDTLLCEGQVLSLNTGQAGVSHLWQDESTASGFIVRNPGTYWVTLTNECGFVSDTLRTTYTTAPIVELGEDTVLCEGESISLDVTWPGASYLWDDLVVSPTRTITTAGIYHVTLFHQCGDREDEIAVEFIAKPLPVNLGDDLTLCTGDTVFFNVSQPNVLYHWQNGSILPTYTVRRSGEYRIRVYNQCGEETDDLLVNYVTFPSVTFGQDTILCEGDTFALDASQGQSVIYRWQNGSSDSIFQVSQPGLYTVRVENICGADGDSVVVGGHSCFCAIHAPTAFTPNSDGFNDLFQLYYDCDILGGTLKVFSRWGEAVFETENPDGVWDGFFRSHHVPEGVYIWVFQYEFQDADRVRSISETGTVTLLR